MPPPIILIYTPAFSNPNTEAVSKNISITAPTSTFVNNYLMPLVSQPVNVIGNAFNRLQPSQYSAFYEQSIELTTFLASMFHASSLSYCCCNPEKKVLCRYETPNIWAQPYRYTFRLHPYDFQIPAFRSDNNGFILGFDYPVIDGWLVGCGGAYNNDLMLWTDNVGKASLNSGFLSLYTEWTNDRFFCGMLAMGGMDSIHLDRQIQYLTVNQTAKSFRRGYDVVGQWKAGAIFEPYGFVLCPYFKLNYLYFHQNNTVEHGADGADLIVQGNTATTFVSELALQLQKSFYFHHGCIAPLVGFIWYAEKPIHRENFISTFVDQTVPFETIGYRSLRNVYSFPMQLSATYKDCSFLFGYAPKFAITTSDKKEAFSSIMRFKEVGSKKIQATTFVFYTFRTRNLRAVNTQALRRGIASWAEFVLGPTFGFENTRP